MQCSCTHSQTQSQRAGCCCLYCISRLQVSADYDPGGEDTVTNDINNHLLLMDNDNSPNRASDSGSYVLLGCNTRNPYSSSSSSSSSRIANSISSRGMMHPVLLMIITLISSSQHLFPFEFVSAAKATIDPRVITYPGDVNFALIIDAHENINRKPFSSESTNSSSVQHQLDCSDRINSDGVLKGMAGIWAAHQVNIRRGKGERLRIGVSVYDACTSAQVIQRQSVRLVASSIFTSNANSNHLPSSSSSSTVRHSCLPDSSASSTSSIKTQPLIFGVVMDTDSEETAAPALSLLDSFSVPVITTSQINQERYYSNNNNTIDSSVFSVAPSLEYMSKGVMALLKRLNWSSATLVISDQVPPSYSSVFEEIAKTGFNFNVIATSPSRLKANRKLNRRNAQLHDFSIPESVKNTLLFLSTREALQLLLSLRSNLPLPGNDHYNWILVTDSDITDKMREIFNRNTTSPCHTKTMFVFVPNSNIPTREFNRYFEHEIATYAEQSVHPLISQFAKQHLGTAGASGSTSGTADDKSKKRLVITSSEGLAMSMSAVWSLALALKKVEEEECVSQKTTKTECMDRLRQLPLREMVLNHTRGMNYEKISGLGVSSMDGFAIKFNPQNILKTNRYQLKIVTSACKVFDAGYYLEDTGLNINEVIFKTLHVESPPQSSSSSNPASTAAGSSTLNHFAVNPLKLNRSIASLRSLRPPALMTGSSLLPTATSSLNRSASFATLNSESDDYSDDDGKEKRGQKNLIFLNSSFTSTTLSPDDVVDEENNSDEDGDNRMMTMMEFARNPRTPPVQDSPSGANLNSMSLPKDLSGSSFAKMATSRSANSANSASAGQTTPRDSNSNLRRFRNVIRSTGSPASLTSWLGKGWSLTLLILAVIGSLITLYTFTFLLMKSCEGSSSFSASRINSSPLHARHPHHLRHNHHNLLLQSSAAASAASSAYSSGVTVQTDMNGNQSLLSLTLFAIMMLFMGSLLFLFEPSTPILCSLKSSVHNIGLVLLFGSLLIQSMSLIYQKTIGLGGQVSMMNQLLTLLFVVGIQISIESHSWRILADWNSHSNIFTYSVYALCVPSSRDYLTQQSYLMVLLCVLIAYCWMSRHEPLTSNEGANLLTSSALICPVYFSAILLCEYFTDYTDSLEDVSRIYSCNRDIITAASMLAIAFICLIVIYVPIMYNIHKYDASLSATSAFTMFRSGGAGGSSSLPGIIDPIRITSHHLSGDHRPILDNLSSASSTSTTSTMNNNAGKNNGDSFLPNPANRLLIHSGGQPVLRKGGKKQETGNSSSDDKNKRKKGISSGGRFWKSGHAEESSGTAGGLLPRDQMIYSPQTNSYHYACNSPNCNFKMQHPTASSGNNSGTPGASAMSQRRFTTGGTTVSSQAAVPPNASALALLSSTPRSSSYLHHPQHPLHVTSSANHTVPLTNYHLPLPAGRGFQSLFPRPGDAISSHFNRFTSMHSSSHHHPAAAGESASAAGITYNRLNPLFETTEGSFRSAYP